MFFVSIQVTYALEAVVVVLEAPIFAEQKVEEKVMFYKRRGETLYLHGSSSEKSDGLFYKTLLPSGRAGYILKEHVLIRYNDIRELDQKVKEFDNTDYRIPEPLDESYPFLKKTGYRGRLQISFGQPNIQAYPYNQRALGSSFELNKEFSFIYTQRANFRQFEDRLYFGAIAGFKLSGVDFVLTSQVASQDLTVFYLGPYLSYEAFKTKKYGLSLYTNFQFILYNNMSIEIKDNTAGTSEKRDFSHPFSISPNIGSAFNFKRSFLNFDTLIGFNLRLITPKTYTSRVAAEEQDLWSSDSFEQSTRAELSYFLGFTGHY